MSSWDPVSGLGASRCCCGQLARVDPRRCHLSMLLFLSLLGVAVTNSTSVRYYNATSKLGRPMYVQCSMSVRGRKCSILQWAQKMADECCDESRKDRCRGTTRRGKSNKVSCRVGEVGGHDEIARVADQEHGNALAGPSAGGRDRHDLGTATSVSACADAGSCRAGRAHLLISLCAAGWSPYQTLYGLPGIIGSKKFLPDLPEASVPHETPEVR